MRPVTQPLPDDALLLQLKQRALVCEGLGPVLDNLHSGMRLNSALSTDGAAVLGLSSPVGSTSFLDLNLGKVGRHRVEHMQPAWGCPRHPLRTHSCMFFPATCSLLLGACWPVLGASSGG